MRRTIHKSGRTSTDSTAEALLTPKHVQERGVEGGPSDVVSFRRFSVEGLIDLCVSVS